MIKFDDRGFTIQELLVVIIVGSLLVSYGLSVFLFADKLFTSWRLKDDIHSRVTRTFQNILYDIEQAKRIQSITDSSLIIIRCDNKVIDYKFDRHHIFRNNEQVATNDSIQMSVEKLQDSGRFSFGETPISVAVKANTKGVEFSQKANATTLRSSRAEFVSKPQKSN